MTIIITILASLLVFGAVVAVHEFGHFTAAKLSGIQVNEFAIGMGPALWKKIAGGTQYTLRLLPVGGYLVLAGVSAVLILPASILIIRYKPQDKGMLPYGYVEGETVAETEETTEDSMRGVSYARAIKSPAFFFCIGFLCLVQLTCCMNQLFPTYASEVGFSPMVGGFMVSAASLFDLFLNPIVGTTCDKFGSTKAILGWLAVSILSFVMLMMSSGNSTLSILAAGVNDVMYVIAGTALTVLVMDVFGSRDFGRIFALICFYPMWYVLVASVTSGNRFETYVLVGPPKTGQIIVNGGAAHLIKKGERVVIMSFALDDKPIIPKRIICNELNEIIS